MVVLAFLVVLDVRVRRRVGAGRIRRERAVCAPELLDAEVRSDDLGEAAHGGGFPVVGDAGELRLGEEGDVVYEVDLEALVQRGEQEGVLVGGQAELVADGRVHARVLRVFYIFMHI